MAGSFRIALVTLMCLFSSVGVFANSADDIIGVWLTEEKDARIEIFKSGKTYAGKIIWGKDLNGKDGGTVKRDEKNPEVSLRSRTILGLQILHGFQYADGQWVEGKIYDPQSGKTYSSKMKLKNGKLELRGYIGTPMLGRTTVWTRVK